jgi:hypothetical protein
VFNQLTQAQLVSAIGATNRAVARSGSMSDFDRDQLMSCYSATRHLAAELTTLGPVHRRFADAVSARAVQAVSAGIDGVEPFAGRLRGSSDPAELGAALSELLGRLRDDCTPESAALRRDLHRFLRDLADQEVNLLAEALG